MLNEYNKQALNFLKATKTSLAIVFDGKKLNNLWGDKELRNSYKCTLENNKGSYTFIFWDSIYNTKHGLKPSEYDVISCLSATYYLNYFDFCYEFGYENTVNSYNIYVSWCNEFAGLSRIFNDEQLSELREIN